MTKAEQAQLFAEWRRLLTSMRENNGPSAIERLAAVADPSGLLAGAIEAYDRGKAQIASLRAAMRASAPPTPCGPHSPSSDRRPGEAYPSTPEPPKPVQATRQPQGPQEPHA